MGNLNTVNNLANLDLSFKDKYIEKYFAIAAPYLGAPIAFKYMIGSNSDFYVRLWHELLAFQKGGRICSFAV